MSKREDLIPPHGGYRKLKKRQRSEDRGQRSEDRRSVLTSDR
jgi:hypothetical protein